MRTVYIYLSWVGWIWFVIVAVFLVIRLRIKQIHQRSMEAKQSHEQ